MSDLVELDSLHLVFIHNNGQVMAKVFRIGKWPWPWPFKVKNKSPNMVITISAINSTYHIKSKWRYYMCIYIQKQRSWIFLIIRWQPYLIWLFRNSWHYGGRAPLWFFMSRDPLTQYKWEIPATPNCEWVYIRNLMYSLCVHLRTVTMYRQFLPKWTMDTEADNYSQCVLLCFGGFYLQNSK